ncbi:MAG: hypothetical protein NTZ57_10135, partial [Deltaproteobacteria bacterium]|nr:hypothetical protein [Deltaproteobacteria bacterium]
MVTISAICWQYFSVTASVGPSTMTRLMFCVPDYRSRTRPSSPSSSSACPIAYMIRGSVEMS